MDINSYFIDELEKEAGLKSAFVGVKDAIKGVYKGAAKKLKKRETYVRYRNERRDLAKRRSGMMYSDEARMRDQMTMNAKPKPWAPPKNATPEELAEYTKQYKKNDPRPAAEMRLKQYDNPARDPEIKTESKVRMDKWKKRTKEDAANVSAGRITESEINIEKGRGIRASIHRKARDASDGLKGMLGGASAKNEIAAKRRLVRNKILDDKADDSITSILKEQRASGKDSVYNAAVKKSNTTGSLMPAADDYTITDDMRNSYKSMKKGNGSINRREFVDADGNVHVAKSDQSMKNGAAASTKKKTRTNAERDKAQQGMSAKQKKAENKAWEKKHNGDNNNNNNDNAKKNKEAIHRDTLADFKKKNPGFEDDPNLREGGVFPKKKESIITKNSNKEDVETSIPANIKYNREAKIRQQEFDDILGKKQKSLDADARQRGSVETNVDGVAYKQKHTTDTQDQIAASNKSWGSFNEIAQDRVNHGQGNSDMIDHSWSLASKAKGVAAVTGLGIVGIRKWGGGSDDGDGSATTSNDGSATTSNDGDSVVASSKSSGNEESHEPYKGSVWHNIGKVRDTVVDAYNGTKNAVTKATDGKEHYTIKRTQGGATTYDGKTWDELSYHEQLRVGAYVRGGGK